ncbi:MAG: DUF4317 domain-containing protein [Clostridia bacterium]|nr:DUF4317 domain-containing protein [Clostridia bacterium]
MINRDILELKKRFKKGDCTFTKVSGCYVNSEKETLLKFQETFLNLPDDELFKYLEIAKKALSGKIGNNLLELNFSLNEDFQNERQQLLMMLTKSGLKEEAILSHFYESVIDAYECPENYLILVFHDAYDVMTKTSDNRKVDESEEVYEYILCTICPVSLSKAGLGYFDQEKKIKSRIRDWVVGLPSIGFTFPGFIDRGSDVDTVMYYTKDTKEPHAEFMEHALGCFPKQTATNQLETFESLVKSAVTGDDMTSDEVFAEIQENLNTMVVSHKETYEDTDEAPIILSKEKVKNLLVESGVPEEITVKIEASYEKQFGEEAPLAENLVDTKLVKKHAQKKKEERLMTQIKELESKLEEVEKVAESGTDDDVMDEIYETADVSAASDDSQESPKYDVILQVKPEKLHTIKTEMINGQRCIIVPIDDNEQATINGIEDLL